MIRRFWNETFFRLLDFIYRRSQKGERARRIETGRTVVLITGASTGIGLATARQLARDKKYLVVATARAESIFRFEKLGLKESEYFWIRALDVTNKVERDELVKEIDSKLGGVDVLINNAGYSLRAVVEHVGEMERFKQMEINFRAPMALIRSVLPQMREKRRGRIINISSVGGMMAMPTMAVYSASKFALEGASEALWYEVKPWNIHVSLIEPGFVNSSSFQNVKTTRESLKALEDKNNAYYHHYHGMSQFIERCMRLSPTTPEKIARKIHRVIEQRSPALRVPATADAHLFYLLRRILPRRFYHGFLYWCLPDVVRWGED